MSEKKDNVVRGKFGVLEDDKEHLLQTLSEMDLDDVLIIGLKGQDTFMAHTDFESRMKLIGAMENLKMWLWTQGYFGGQDE